MLLIDVPFSVAFLKMDLPEQVTDNRKYFYFICKLCCHNLLCFNRPILIIKHVKVLILTSEHSTYVTSHKQQIRSLIHESREECSKTIKAQTFLCYTYLSVYVCDTSEPSHVLIYSNTFPDYRVPALNIGLTSHIFLSHGSSPTHWLSLYPVI